MSTQMSGARHERAARGLAELGTTLADHQVLSVQCASSHHVAAVYETPVGLVFRSMTGPHAHGRMDLPDVAHHGAEHGETYTELLDSEHADVMLPAHCACGDWSLSREHLLADVRSGNRTTHVS